MLRAPDADYETFRPAVEHTELAIRTNAIIGLIKVTNYLLNQQIRQLEQAFIQNGGIREAMTRKGDLFSGIRELKTVNDRMDILMSWLYGRDLNNQVTNITKGVTADEAGSLVSYSYDAVGQLTDESSGENTSSFIYDAMGNRLSSSENCSGGSQNRSYAPNSQNQYTAITTSGLSSQSSSFSCNANGALTSKIECGSPLGDPSKQTTYTYNAAERLASVEIRHGTGLQDGDTRADYTYDPFGRRISKKVYEWDSEISDYKSPVSSFYLYSDEGLIAEFDALGSLTTAYGWKPGSVWMNSPVTIRTAKDGVLVTGYYLNDHLGAPQKVVDRSGVVIWSMQSTAFGSTTVDPASTIVSNLRFSSQYFDAETGLHYNTLRYYDPQTGRWLSKDPIGISGGLNLYAFCGNNPVNFIDPLGLEDITFLGPGDDNYGRGPASGGQNVTVITAHCNGQVIQNNTTTASTVGSVLNGTQAGNALKGMVPSGDLIILYACSAGTGLFAQDMANAIGNTVLAPLGKVYPDGTVRDPKTGDVISPRDAWKPFSPKKKKCP